MIRAVFPSRVEQKLHPDGNDRGTDQDTDVGQDETRDA
jgi:hypothetical protein